MAAAVGLDLALDDAQQAIADEVARYWTTVYGNEDEVVFPASIAAFMERNRDFGGGLPSFSPRQEARLRRTLGEPHYEDRDLLVWRLGSQVAPTARILVGRNSRLVSDSA